MQESTTPPARIRDEVVEDERDQQEENEVEDDEMSRERAEISDAEREAEEERRAREERTNQEDRLESEEDEEQMNQERIPEEEAEEEELPPPGDYGREREQELEQRGANEMQEEVPEQVPESDVEERPGNNRESEADEIEREEEREPEEREASEEEQEEPLTEEDLERNNESEIREEDQETEDNETKDETEDQDDRGRLGSLKVARPRAPLFRLLISSRRRPPPFRPYRPGVRRMDYRKYYGPHDLSSEFGVRRRRPRPPPPRRWYDRPRPEPIISRHDVNRKYRMWGNQENRAPKKGISLTQVFVNKPPHPPLISHAPILSPHVNPYPLMVPAYRNPLAAPYRSPLLLGYPSFSYTRSLSLKGKQQSGSPPQVSGTYQSSSWPGYGPVSHVKINFAPKFGEPNLGCLRPPAVQTCIFGVPASIPFWSFDAHRGQCEPFYFAGCEGLNKFGSRSECESTCLGKSYVCFRENDLLAPFKVARKSQVEMDFIASHFLRQRTKYNEKLTLC